MCSAQSAALPVISWRPWPVHSRAEVVYLLGEQHAAERVVQRLFGRILDPREHAGLAGAPDDARVEIGASDGKLYLEIHDPRSAAYRGFYYVYCKKSLVLILNDGFCIQARDRRGRGFGFQVFFRQARNAAAFGVDRIETVAGRNRDENGYYTWPRYGFEGKLPSDVQHDLPGALRHCRTILDLMLCEQGRSWWREHGVKVAVAFHLALRSRSRTVLQRYVREKIASGYG